jgi:hypothetical protein
VNLNTGYIPYKSTTLINSPIYTNGTNILINSTADNGNKFQVSGNTYLGGNISQPINSLYYSMNYASGWGNTGFGLSTDANGVSNMVLDNLTVRKTMSIYS